MIIIKMYMEECIVLESTANSSLVRTESECCMNKGLIVVSAILFIAASILFSGCGNKESLTLGENHSQNLTIIDDNHREVLLANTPERIVVLSPSFLEILDQVQGKVVGRATSQIAQIPERYKDSAEVGFVYRINSEAVVRLQPDLVIAYKGMHENLLPILEANHIPVIVLNLKTYQDVKRNCELLGLVSGHADLGQDLAKKLDNGVQDAIANVPLVSKKTVILHTTMNDISVETEDSIAGSVAALLHLDLAIKSGDMPIAKMNGMASPDKIVYSMEALVEKDPEVLFITSMGANGGALERIKSEMENNPAWLELQAVKNKQVFFLPEDLFLLNPGLRYPEAVRYMVEQLYPKNESR